MLQLEKGRCPLGVMVLRDVYSWTESIVMLDTFLTNHSAHIGDISENLDLCNT